MPDPWVWESCTRRVRCEAVMMRDKRRPTAMITLDVALLNRSIRQRTSRQRRQHDDGSEVLAVGGTSLPQLRSSRYSTEVPLLPQGPGLRWLVQRVEAVRPMRIFLLSRKRIFRWFNLFRIRSNTIRRSDRWHIARLRLRPGLEQDRLRRRDRGERRLSHLVLPLRQSPVDVSGSVFEPAGQRGL